MAKTASSKQKKPASVNSVQADDVARLRAALAEAQRRIADLEKHANIDPLLDILNRRGFERELRRAIAYVKRYSVSAALVYLDVDRLKPVNDTFGHAAGDAYLVAMAQALARSVRQSDTLARLGGDEFVILLWNINEHDAQIKAAALEDEVDALAMPVYVLATREDHIVPWRSAYETTRILGGKARFVLGASGHIAGAVSIPIEQLTRQLRNLPADVDVVAYCRGPYCVFADEAVQLLRRRGRHARRLEDGFPEWRTANLPTQSLNDQDITT